VAWPGICPAVGLDGHDVRTSRVTGPLVILLRVTGPAYCFISSPLKAVCQAFVQLGVPIQGLGFDMLGQVFCQWARQPVDLSENGRAQMGGKAIKGTMGGHSADRQRFINLADNPKESGAPAVRGLVTSLGLSGATFALDALHRQKKRQA